MTRLGGTTTKYYKDTRGIKVSGGQFVRAGTVLTRCGDRWKAGKNVIGRMHLTAACDGIVYFTHKKGRYKFRVNTYVHVQPLDKEKEKRLNRE